MSFKYLFFLHFIRILHFTVGQDCTLPAELWGQWTSTNLETMTFSGTTPSLTMSKTFSWQSVTQNDFNCRYVSGTRYVLQSVSSFSPFTDTSRLFMWMCLDLRRTSAYSYYYYLQSDEQAGFDNYRLVGLPESSSVTVSQVCTATLSISEFNTMIKTGDESAAVAAVECSVPLLGSFTFTYSDSSVSSVSSTTSFISSCNQWNRTHIFVNNSGLTGVYPFHSTGGLVGCIANIHDSTSGIYYTSLYNLDSSPNPEFICVAYQQIANGTVILSTKEMDCAADQIPTTLPTGGSLMVLTPDCVPATPSKTQNWTWLFVFLPFVVLLIVFVVVFACLHVRLKAREKDLARSKKVLEHENHPLGEMSMPLDAPASLDRRNSYIDEDEELLTRRRKPVNNKNILGEQSMNLNLDHNKWSHLDNVKHPGVTTKARTISNGALGKRRVNKMPAPSVISRSQSHKSHTSRTNITKSNMLEKKLSNSKLNGFLKSNTSLSLGPKSRTIKTVSRHGSSKTNGIHPVPRKPLSRPSSSLSRRGSIDNLVIDRNKRALNPGSSKKNGIHPAPRKPLSRPSSSLSRRGSIDNLVIDRNKRALSQKRTPRSNTVVLSSSAIRKNDKPNVSSPSEVQPAMFTMPEEFQTEDGSNQLIPERPSPTPRRNLVDTYRSLRTFRSDTSNRLLKPHASRKSWR